MKNKFGIRENLENHKHYLYVECDGEIFDIWSFNNFCNALAVKKILNKDDV